MYKDEPLSINNPSQTKLCCALGATCNMSPGKFAILRGNTVQRTVGSTRYPTARSHLT